MSLFPLTDDLQAFLKRVVASLERVDGAVADVQRLVREATGLVQDIRQDYAKVKAVLKDDDSKHLQ